MNETHIVNEYNNTYYKTIKMKPVDVTSSTYIEFGVKNHEKVPKFNVYDHVRISNMFAKIYVPNWSEEVFRIKKYCVVDIYY